jgi:hypothetical protein
MGCKHVDKAAETLRCTAFERIPDPIIRSEADHRLPYEGDHGIRFEPETPADARYADEVFG